MHLPSKQWCVQIYIVSTDILDGFGVHIGRIRGPYRLYVKAERVVARCHMLLR